MSASVKQLRDDFDRLALLTEYHGSAGDAYHKYLLRQLPLHCETALEIGCGTGEFTRLLATRAQSVIAIDLSPQMLRLAQQQSTRHSNIEYVNGDVMRLSLAAAAYDCVVSIATLHHLSQDAALPKMKAALKPDGVLIIHDLLVGEGLLGRIMDAVAYPLSIARRCWKTGRLRAPRELREAWDEHGRGEVYPTPSEVKEMCRQHLPGALVKRHLLWRYTVVWQRRGST